MARAGLRAGGGGGAQGRMRSRGVGRASSFFLPAARSPSLLAFYRGRDRQQAPFPPQAAVVADGWGRRRRCRGVEARRRGGRLERLQAQGKRGRDTSNKKQALRSATEAHSPPTVASTRVQLQGRIPALGRRGRGGRCRRLHPSSFARLHPCTPPPLPCEWWCAATGIRPRHLLAAGGGGAGSACGGSRSRRPSPTKALDLSGATALARRRCTPEHDCGVAEAAPLVLHASTLRRGRAAAVAAARRRLRSPLASGPCRTFGGSLLPPHALCGGIWVTFAVPLHCRLPPYPPIRVAASAMRRAPDRPGHSFPSNPATPCRTPHPATNTLALIDETHVRDIETQNSMQGDAWLRVQSPVLALHLLDCKGTKRREISQSKILSAQDFLTHRTVTRPSDLTNTRMATPTTLPDTVCTGTHGGGVVVCVVVAWCIPIAAVPPTAKDNSLLRRLQGQGGKM